MSPEDKPSARGAADLSAVDALTQLSFLVQRLLERRAAAAGLSMIQIRLLGVLRDREPTMLELAKLLDLDKSSTSGLITRAERRGLVERIPSTVDRRVVTVRLTQASRELVSTVTGGFESDIAELLASLSSAERHALTGAATRAVFGNAGARGVDLTVGTSAGQ